MRLETFTHLLRLPVPYFDKTPLGKNLHYVTSDMENINEFITSGIVTSVGDILTITGILAVMVYLEYAADRRCHALFPYPRPCGRYLSATLPQRLSANTGKCLRDECLYGESLAGFSLQGVRSQEAEIAGFRRRNEQYMTAFKRVILYMSLYFPFVESIGILSILAILLSSGYMLSLGMVTFGTIVAFIEYSHRLYNPIRDLSEKYNIYQNAHSSLEKLHTLRVTEAEEGMDAAAPRRSGETSNYGMSGSLMAAMGCMR